MTPKNGSLSQKVKTTPILDRKKLLFVTPAQIPHMPHSLLKRVVMLPPPRGFVRECCLFGQGGPHVSTEKGRESSTKLTRLGRVSANLAWEGQQNSA
jgi:hypothetical protein